MTGEMGTLPVFDATSELIDTETGEIIEVENPTTDDLAKYTRALRAIDYKRQLIKKYHQAEIDRIGHACGHEILKLSDQYDRVAQITERLLRLTGQSKQAFPGLGSVRIGKSRETLNTSVYDAMTDDERANIQNKTPAFFNIKTTCIPDKRVLLAALQVTECDEEKVGEIAKALPEGFSVNPQVEKFVFKAEKS